VSVVWALSIATLPDRAEGACSYASAGDDYPLWTSPAPFSSASMLVLLCTLLLVLCLVPSARVTF